MSRRAASEVLPFLLALMALGHAGYGAASFLFRDAWADLVAGAWKLLFQAELAVLFLALSLGLSALNELRDDLQRRRWSGTADAPKRSGEDSGTENT